MKMLSKATAALLVAGFGMGVAHAGEPMQIASIAGLEGKVMIHKGKDYTFAKEGQALVQGDRVVALRDSTAKVAFGSGCIATIGENSVLAIDEKANCAAKEPVKVAQALGTTKTDAGGGLTGGGAGGGFMEGGMGALAGLGGVLGVSLLDRQVNEYSTQDSPISGQ